MGVRLHSDRISAKINDMFVMNLCDPWLWKCIYRSMAQGDHFKPMSSSSTGLPYWYGASI